MKTIADTLGVARSNLAAHAAPKTARQRRGRRPQPEDELLAEIKQAIAGQPTYGYRRIHALVRRRRAREDRPAVNAKRVYRVMKVHSLLLERHSGKGQERRHDGRVAVDCPDTRWCSDGFEIGCDNSLPPRRRGASASASPSRWTAATARQSPGWRRPAASIATISAT